MDPYSTEQHQGGVKPSRSTVDDTEGGTRVVGPRSYTGGIAVPKGVQRTALDHDPRTAIGVQRTVLDHDPRQAMGVAPTRLGYNPEHAVGCAPTRVNVGHEGGSRAPTPWYTVKAKIGHEGVGEKNYAYVCKCIQLHASVGSFVPAPITQLLARLAHFGDSQAQAALAYAQQVEAHVRAQMRQRGQ